MASLLSLKVKFVRCTRGSFNFPGAQSFPRKSFTQKVTVFETHFSKLGLTREACVLGGTDKPKKWHVYFASVNSIIRSYEALVYTVEMCMTGLARDKAAVFYKSYSNSTASMTEDSGIRKILLKSYICGFEFEPCGYSMNSIEGPAISTIDVTLEDGFSYASFESVGYNIKTLSLNLVVERVLNCFKTKELYVVVHADVVAKFLEFDSPLSLIGYRREEARVTELGLGGSIVYQNFCKTDVVSVLGRPLYLPLK